MRNLTELSRSGKSRETTATNLRREKVSPEAEIKISKNARGIAVLLSSHLPRRLEPQRGKTEGSQKTEKRWNLKLP